MATNYRQLRWEGTAGLASSVKWVNGNTTVYPAVVKWGTDTVFARAMDVTMTTKDGINSISYTFAAGDASAAISRGTYGFFWGDTFTATPVAASWWTVTPASKTVVLNGNYFDLSSSATPSTLYMRDFFTASRLPRALSVTGDAHVQVTGNYINTSNNSATVTTKSTTTKTVTDAWQGATVTFSATADKYWKINNSSGLGTHEPGTTNLAASAQSRIKTRSISFTKKDGIDSITVTWYSTDTSGSTTATPNVSGSVTTSSFSGQPIDITPNATQYWSAPGAYTIEAANNEAAIYISPTATRLPRTIKIVGDAHATVSLSYTNTNGDPASGSATTTVVTKSDVFQGAAATTTATYATYWKKDSEANIGTIAKGATDVFAKAVSTRKLRTITVTKSSHISAITVTYTTSSETEASQSFTASGSIVNTFSGGKVTYSAAAAPYYTTSGGTVSEADNENGVTVAPAPTEKKRAIDVRVNSGIDSITIKYLPSTGAMVVTTTPNVSGAVTNSSFSGAVVTWSAAAADYFILSTTSGTIAAANNTAKVTVAPPAGLKLSRYAGVTRGTYWTRGISAATMYFVSSTGTSTTRTNASIPLTATGSYDKEVWQGGEVTFSISANNGWTFTAPAAIEPGSTTVRRTVNPHVIPSRLDLCCTGSVSATDDAKIQITIVNYTGAQLSSISLSNKTYAYDSNDSAATASTIDLPQTLSAGGSYVGSIKFSSSVGNGYGAIYLNYTCNSTTYECEVFSW